ncbi:MAG: GDSL-type esterase/lipase family protein [Rhodospirillales bacterium]
MAVLRICFIGDSITLGTADAEFLGWPGRLCRTMRAQGHDLSLYNLGVRAETTALIQKRWRAEAAPRLPEIAEGRLVFAFGVNDSAIDIAGSVRVPPPQSIANARAMLAEAKAWKPTIWVGPAPVNKAGQRVSPGPGVRYDFANQRIAELDRLYAGAAKEIGVPYLSVYPKLIGDPAWHAALGKGDGVHAAGAGYALVAAQVAAWDAWRAWF